MFCDYSINEYIYQLFEIFGMGSTFSCYVDLPVALVQHVNQQQRIDIESELVILIYNGYDKHGRYNNSQRTTNNIQSRLMNRHALLVRELNSRGYVVMRTIPMIDPLKMMGGTHGPLMKCVRNKLMQCVRELRDRQIDIVITRTTIICIDNACEWMFSRDIRTSDNDELFRSLKNARSVERINIDHVVMINPIARTLRYSIPIYDTTAHAIITQDVNQNEADNVCTTLEKSFRNTSSKLIVDRIKDVTMDDLIIKSTRDTNEKDSKQPKIEKIIDAIVGFDKIIDRV